MPALIEDVPLIFIDNGAPGSPEEAVISTPAIRPCRAWSIVTDPNSSKSLALIFADAVVKSLSEILRLPLFVLAPDTTTTSLKSPLPCSSFMLMVVRPLISSAVVLYPMYEKLILSLGLVIFKA